MSVAAAAGARGVGAGRLETWFFAPVPAHAMVLARFLLGGVLFCHALSRLPEFGRVYGAGGVAWAPVYRAFAEGFLARDAGRLPLTAVSLLAQLPAEVRDALLPALFAGLLASSLAFALGLFTRAAGAAAIALHVLFVAVHPLAHYGWAGMLAPFATYVVLSRAGDYASLDAWRRRRRGEAPPDGTLPAWPMRLLQIHVAAMYFHSGFARIDDPDWLRGEVLYEALARDLFTRFTLDLHAWKPALRLLSYAVFLLEPAAAFLLWIPKVRTLCALALLAMHGILELLTNVGWWNPLMVAGLVTFLPPAWVARATPGVPRALPGTRPGGAAAAELEPGVPAD